MNFSGKFFLVFTLVLGLVPLFESTLLSLTTDREALVSFKSQISGSPNPLAAWDSSLSPCNWTGVSCDKLDQRVVKLDLSGMGMTGSVSPFLGNLSFLESLELQQNRFTGNLPPQLGNLFRLRVLNLSSNALEGVIPCNLTPWKELRVLDLRQNKISGNIPAEIRHLAHLQVLNLQGNMLSGQIPPFLANVSSLTYLNLGTNELTGSIPMELGRLNRLKVLDLTVNNLSGAVPPSIYNISSLVHLGLASNELWGEIPGDIGLSLPNLEAFISCFNSFTGTFPWSLHNLTNIKTIRISHNRLHGGIPPGLGNLPNLEMYKLAHNSITTRGPGGLQFLELLSNSTRLYFLALDYNFLEGEIPMSIGNLSKVLMKLYLSGNDIYGAIPSSIGELKGLGLLSLMDNDISGEIPHEIGQLKELNILELSNNRLSGIIPSSLGVLQHLTKIDLSRNELTGSIPYTLGNLRDLISLDLSYNKLNGSIANEIFKLHKLSAFLNLSANHLTGVLPAGIGFLKHVTVISISDNRLSGHIPTSITRCASLEKLYLARNMFSGHIPVTLGDVKGLETLDLSSNLLSGVIPIEWENLKSLQSLNLSFNKLEGRVPKGGIFSDPYKVHLEGNPDLYVALFKNSNARNRQSTFMYIVISVASVVLISSAICLLYYIIRSKTANKISSMESLTGEYETITYTKLRVATDDFAPENLIGRGSFGCVYKGHLQGVDIAIKVLDTAVPRSRKSFLAECVALKNVRHRNLVKLINICSTVDSKNKEFLALIFQLMSNGSLDEWIRGNRRHPNGTRLNLFDRLTSAIGIASAIDYLHNETNVPVLHCDLKPSNVLLDSDMTPKVADFGLAKLLLDENNNLSFGLSHTITGSIGYIPPEYGVGKIPSTAGDVYSFGILLLELFTGKSPTDDIFTAGLSLRSLVQEEFPDNLEQILDSDLLQEMQDAGGKGELNSKLENQGECLNRVFWTALSCTADSPSERISVREALCKLKAAEKGLIKPKSSETPSFATVMAATEPPSERTRLVVRNRLVETLASPSLLSRCYGTVSLEEAEYAAKVIEVEAFESVAAAASSDEDEMEILQAYSKEISRRMVDMVKARSDELTAAETQRQTERVDEAEVDGAAAGSTTPGRSGQVEAKSASNAK